jgi:phage minor structural protein
MIQIYADDVLAYDSRLEDYDLLQLPVTTALNKGGTAEITMPAGHPAYTAYTEYSTMVHIYRDNVLLFRGRALYMSDDFYRQRTVTCEGELCFFQDAISRPYLYQDSPEAVFAAVVSVYNSQVEERKQFQVGTVTVTDSNDYIRLESESAETTLDTLNKLLTRCGGYIIFTTNNDGQRVVNWYEVPGYRSSQEIDLDLGGNLLSFARNGANTNLATALIPYGAKDESTGKRLTIESVNDGLDYIVDEEAEAIRGRITTTAVWDDVTEPANLLRKAQQYLADRRQIVTSLELTALDLSLVDKTVDSYRVGDTIHVRSKPHGVDDDFRLTERTEDLLNPAGSKITLGKEQTSLTGAAVAGDVQTSTGMQKTESQIAALYQLNQAASLEEIKETLVSLIQQTSEQITLEVSETYATNDRVTDLVATSMSQLADSFTFLFTELQTTVDANDAELREQVQTIERYIRFEDGNILLGESGNELTLRIENDRISFIDAGAEVAYFSDRQLVVLDGHFLNSLRVGSFAWLPRENGNLSLVKVGD